MKSLGFSKEESDHYLDFHKEVINSNAVIKNAKRIHFVFGEQDAYITKNFRDHFQKLFPNTNHILLEKYGHMGTSETSRSISEINSLIPELTTYKRECDTFDAFMCSSFYFLRYPDAHNDNALCDPTLLNKMFPIELYIGGKEHTVGHLLYSRFIHKFLYDQGYVPSPEPFQKLVHQGMVLGSDGRKMSKRRGNVIDPLEVIEMYGADAVRMYLMFMGPVEQDKTRNDNALKGMAKFLQRVAALQPPTGVNFRSADEYLKKAPAEHDAAQKKVTSAYHKTVKGITEDMEKMKFNTAVSKIMILVNTIYEVGVAPQEVLNGLTTMIAPFATELAQTMRTGLGHAGDVHAAQRPIADTTKMADELISLPVQINGKMRGNVEITPGTTEENVLKEAQKVENVAKYLAE